MANPIVFLKALQPDLLNEDVLSRTAKLTGRGASCGDVLNLLRQYNIPVTDIEGISGGNTGDEGITVLFKDDRHLDFLRSETLVFRNKHFNIVALGKQVIRIRVHWLPLYVSDSAIKSIFCDYGKVLAVKNLFTNMENVSLKMV